MSEPKVVRRPQRALLTAELVSVGTEESYNLGKDRDNTARVLECLAADVRAGRLRLRMNSTVKREVKARVLDLEAVVVEIDGYFHFEGDMDYVLGPRVHEPPPEFSADATPCRGVGALHRGVKGDRP